jgi:AAA+ superfamily predicted ATPase
MLVDKVDGKLPLDAVIDFDALAEHSKGLSGGDIQQVVLRAARTAATRPKEKQMISTDDLLQEVVHAFSIKEKVGQST